MSQTKEQDLEKDQTYAAMLDMARANGLSNEEFGRIYKAVESGATMAEIFNISKDTLESGYAYAYQLYQAGNYEDAEKLFRGLTLYSNRDARLWMGLAGCLQARNAYSDAIDAYTMAGVVSSLKDPAPFYYACLCYIKMGDRENAIAGLKGALTIGDENDPAHKTFHDRMKGLLASLEQPKE